MAYRRFYEVNFSESQVKLANVELLASSTLILLLKLMTLLVFLTQKISKKYRTGTGFQRALQKYSTIYIEGSAKNCETILDSLMWRITKKRRTLLWK